LPCSPKSRTRRGTDSRPIYIQADNRALEQDFKQTSQKKKKRKTKAGQKPEIEKRKQESRDTNKEIREHQQQ
jgi:hypothetical protein